MSGSDTMIPLTVKNGKGFRVGDAQGVIGGHQSFKFIGCNEQEATNCKFFKI